MKCPFCGAAISSGKRFCPECGKYLTPEIRNSEEEPAVAAEQAPSADMPEQGEPETPATEAPVFEAPEPKLSEEPAAEPLPESEGSTKPADEPSGNDQTDETPENVAKAPADETLSVMPTDPNKPATADLMIPVEPDPKPEKNSQWATVNTWGWIGIRLLMLVPIVNIVFLLIWSFGGSKKNVKQSWARATLVWVLLLMILALGLLLYLLLHPSVAVQFGNLF